MGKNSKDYYWFGILTPMQITVYPHGYSTRTTKCRWIPNQMKSCRSFVRESRICPRLSVWETAEDETEIIHILYRDNNISTLRLDKIQSSHPRCFHTASSFPLGFTERDQIFIIIHCVGHWAFFFFFLNGLQIWQSEPNWAQTSWFLCLESELFWKHALRCMWLFHLDGAHFWAPIQITEMVWTAKPISWYRISNISEHSVLHFHFKF